MRVEGAPLADSLSLTAPDRSVDDLREQVEHEVRFANITIIEGNDASQFGIGVGCARITEGILGDERVVMPVAAFRERYGGAIGLPTVVGREGAAGELEVVARGIDAISITMRAARQAFSD